MKMIQNSACIVILSLFCLLNSSFAQNFPSDWAGKWQGNLAIYNPAKGKTMEVTMQLTITATENPSQWGWEIVYNTGEKQDIRKYVLLAQDPAVGHYLIDEQNSILLDSYLVNQRLISAFDVSNNRLMAIYHFQPEQIVFTILSSGGEYLRQSGGSNDTPLVDSFKLQAFQEAVLKRIP
ncbi:MAG TPA: hypothetical protein DCM08_08900 [Microscillaceae bacterium]|jgi:hypothetical protein|nr:hypothetical protein [Microscillaceae bacterium]